MTKQASADWGTLQGRNALAERARGAARGRGANPPRLIRNAAAFAAAFNVSPTTIARLELYERLLRQWQKAVNLVAPSTLGQIWHRHFADSAQLAPLLPAVQTWVDLGSGGGFPGLVVAILLAEREELGERGGRQPNVPRVTLVERNQRKCAFLSEVVRQTGILPRVAVDILSTSGELAATQAILRGSQVISARALAPLDRLLGLTAPLFSPGAVGVFLKGRDVAAELEVAQGRWNFTVELVASRTEPDGCIVMIRQLEPKPKATSAGRTAKE